MKWRAHTNTSETKRTSVSSRTPFDVVIRLVQESVV